MASTATPALKLVIEKGPRSGETLEFNPTTSVRIGRVVRGNNLPIKDAGISSKHLKIEFSSDSCKWVLTDLESSNGTILNTLQLQPHTPFELREGDEIKIGELTSIRVEFVEIGAVIGRRRNPRRQPPQPVSKSAVEALENNPNLEEDVRKGVESGVNLGKDNRKGRGRPPKQANVEEKQANVQEKQANVEVGIRRTRNSKKKGDELLSLADPVPVRRTRNAKNAEKLQKNEDLEVGNSKHVENAKVVQLNKGRGRGRKKKAEVICADNNDDPQDTLLEDVSEPKNLDAGELPREEEAMSDIVQQFAIVDTTNEGETAVGGSHGEQDKCQRLESDAGDGVDEEEQQETDELPDLEKMTLGDWFDYLEVYLPKQIRDATDEIIEDMRKRAEQFDEFMLQQVEKKGKVPVGS